MVMVVVVVVVVAPARIIIPQLFLVVLWTNGRPGYCVDGSIEAVIVVTTRVIPLALLLLLVCNGRIGSTRKLTRRCRSSPPIGHGWCPSFHCRSALFRQRGRNTKLWLVPKVPVSK